MVEWWGWIPAIAGMTMGRWDDEMMTYDGDGEITDGYGGMADGCRMTGLAGRIREFKRRSIWRDGGENWQAGGGVPGRFGQIARPILMPPGRRRLRRCASFADGSRCGLPGII